MKNRTIRKKGGGSCPFAAKGGGSCAMAAAKPMMGGSCGLMSTSQYGASIYGNAGEQHAAPGAGNLIAMKVPETATLIGGRRRRRKGGSTVADLGVPLVLMGLNSAMSRKRRGSGGRKGSSKRRSFRRRR